jgi:hypothetical protein
MCVTPACWVGAPAGSYLGRCKQDGNFSFPSNVFLIWGWTGQVVRLAIVMCQPDSNLCRRVGRVSRCVFP